MKAYALKVSQTANGFTVKIVEVNHRSTMRAGGSNFDDGKAQFKIYSKPDVISVHVDSETVGYVAFSHTKEGAERLRMAWIALRIAGLQKTIEQAQVEATEWINELNRLNAIELNAESKPLSKKFGVDFHSAGGALTLRPSDIGEHPSGWVVSGKIKEDWFEWVNEFDAVHPALGRVWGDFESEVFFTSIEAYEDFRKYFNPEDWDYWDI